MTSMKGPLVGVAAAAMMFAGISMSTVRSSTTRVGSVRAGKPMLEPRSGHTATLLADGRVLIAGGMRRNQDFYKSAEVYDPKSETFNATGEMELGRVGQAAVRLADGQVLIAGGWIGHGSTDEAELYDPGTGKFTKVGKMTAKRGRPSATLLRNGDVLIAGGGEHDAPGGVSTAEVFRAMTRTFVATAPMHDARISHTATLLGDGRVLIAGGRGERVNASAEIYDPGTMRFTLTGAMKSARYKHTAGLLPDGRVLVAGGSDERDWNGALSSAEIYDPKLGGFRETESLAESRFKLPDEAATLNDGNLLIAGGSKEVELYDSRGGGFLAVAGVLSGPWHFMTETRLNDGSVLLTGGYANDDRATAETYRYVP